MKVKCLTSFFSQKQSGTTGQIIEIKDQQVIDSLLASGYIEVMESTSPDPNATSFKEEPTKNSIVKKMNAKTKKAVDNHENE